MTDAITRETVRGLILSMTTPAILRALDMKEEEA